MTVIDILSEITEAGLQEFYDWVQFQDDVDPSLFDGPLATEPTLDELLAWYKDEPDVVEAIHQDLVEGQQS